jgi:hypothetical protein
MISGFSESFKQPFSGSTLSNKGRVAAHKTTVALQKPTE